MSRLFDYLLDAVRSPREQLSRGQHFVRHSCDLTVHCGRQLRRQRAEGMAAELTYRTIFALIPVVVLGLVMFRIVGGLDEVRNQVEYQLYSFFGVPDVTTANVGSGASAAANVELTLEPALPSGGTTDVEIVEIVEIVEADRSDAREFNGQHEAEAIMQAQANIRQVLHEATAKVSSIDFKSIGVFGLMLFMYAAIALANSTEHLFNRIYDAPRQRPMHIRLAIHWSIITLGIGLLALSLYMSAQVVDWFVAIGDGLISKLIVSHLFSIAAGWVLLFLLYALMPNTNVSLHAAAIGSLVGALLWEFAKFGFQIYLSQAVPYSAIYGSIGLIPLFLFWIYVTWVIVLFGLILTYTLQSLGGGSLNRMDRDEHSLPAGDPDWMLPIMSEVGHAFHNGESIDKQSLADQIGLSSRVVHEMANKLVDAAMLRKVTSGAGGKTSLTLARPAEQIKISEILELAHHVRPTSSHPAWKTLANLKQAERDAANERTLADINQEFQND
jgi:membrane protein